MAPLPSFAVVCWNPLWISDLNCFAMGFLNLKNLVLRSAEPICCYPPAIATGSCAATDPPLPLLLQVLRSTPRSGRFRRACCSFPTCLAVLITRATLLRSRPLLCRSVRNGLTCASPVRVRREQRPSGRFFSICWEPFRCCSSISDLLQISAVEHPDSLSTALFSGDDTLFWRYQRLRRISVFLLPDLLANSHGQRSTATLHF